jgi:hypothetical protein
MGQVLLVQSIERESQKSTIDDVKVIYLLVNETRSNSFYLYPSARFCLDVLHK